MLNQLVKHTAVSTRFSANMVALVGAQPRTLNLKDFLQHFLDFRYSWKKCVLCGFASTPWEDIACSPALSLHALLGSNWPFASSPPHKPARHPAACHALISRCEVVERRAQHELGRAQQRLHLVDGFLAAMNHLDAVVQVRLVWQLPDPVACVCYAAACVCAVSPDLQPIQLIDSHPCPHLPCLRQAIRSAPDAASASAALQSPPFDLSKQQAEGVLGLTLRRLTSLEAAKLQEEQATLQAK